MGYVISPALVASELSRENDSLRRLIDTVYSLQERTNLFITNDKLSGKSYEHFKEYYKRVHIPLQKGILLFAEAKIEENESYQNEVNSFWGSATRIEEDELEEWLARVRYLRSIVDSDGAMHSHRLTLERVEELILKLLQKVYDYIKKTNQIYANGQSVILLKQIERGNKCLSSVNYDSPTQEFQVIPDDMKWASVILKIEDKKYEDLAQKYYDVYLRENPDEKEKVITILKYEAAYPDDAKKVDEFLAKLNTQDVIGIKNVAYGAPSKYRELWLKYMDKYSIKSIDCNKTSYFSQENNGLYLNIVEERSDERGAYYTFFHECGHGIDYNCGLELGKGWLSGAFKNEKGKCLNNQIFADVRKELGSSIDEVLNGEEYSECSAKQKKEGKERILSYLTEGRKVKLKDGEIAVIGALQKKYNNHLFRGATNSVASDIYGAATNKEISGAYGHDKDYWWSKDGTKIIQYPNKECFAEYYSYNMLNDKKGLESMKKYLSESYQCLDEIIKEMNP